MATIRRTSASVLSAALLGVVSLGACSSSGRDTTSTAGVADVAQDAAFAGRAATTVAPSEGEAAPTANRGAGDGVGDPTAVPLPPLGRKVVVTVTLDVEVSDVGASSVKATSVLEGLQGYVANQQTNFGGPGRTASSSIVMKVPPANVSALLTALSRLGTVLTQTQQSADVTAAYVDLESRISAARASVERVRLFMAETSDVRELAAIESELTRRSTELEQLLGQQRVLSSQTEMATVTLTLQPADVTAATTSTDDDMTVGKALEQGVDALAGAGLAIAIAAAWVAPWVIPASVVAGVVALLRRRRSPGRSEEPGLQNL